MEKRKMGPKFRVGDDISKPMRVPLSMQDSVASLIKLHRGRGSCPQLYAAVAMYKIYKMFDDKLNSIPIWSADTTEIRSYLNSLITALIELYSRKKDDQVISEHIDSMEDVLEKVDYSMSDITMFKLLNEKIEYIESVEKLLYKHRIPPFVKTRIRYDSKPKSNEGNGN